MQLTSRDWACPKTTRNARVIKGSKVILEFPLKLVTIKGKNFNREKQPKGKEQTTEAPKTCDIDNVPINKGNLHNTRKGKARAQAKRRKSRTGYKRGTVRTDDKEKGRKMELERD